MEKFARNVGSFLERKRRTNNIGKTYACGCDYAGPDCGYGSPNNAPSGPGCGYTWADVESC